MRVLRRLIALSLVLLIVVLIGFGVAKSRRQYANAAFIAAAKLETVVIESIGLARRALVHVPAAATAESKLLGRM